MTNIGRYEIVESLGAGSMGTVYRARDTVLDREVALKTIRTGTTVEPELRERFHREAKACARLQHPGIVSVYDLGEADHVAYIAMELLIGHDFRKAIDQRIEYTLAQKLAIMCQVCDALAHAHRRGIIHRDVKPSNLFLLNDMRAKVLDFGIARLPSSHLTVAGQILGTPNYMAPEQILSKPADTRSDLFSAALVFFEFLVHSHPFKSPLIPRRVVEGDPDSLFDYDSSLPGPLDKIFARALAKDPDQRYSTGTEFADDLQALLDSVKKDSSPTFTRTVLPSDREIPVEATNMAYAPAPVDLTLMKQPPPGEDAYEWRLSEVLRLVPEFEVAVESGNASVAQRLLSEIEAINAVDARFADAVKFCRSMLAKIAPPPKVEAARVPDPLSEAITAEAPRPGPMPMRSAVTPAPPAPPVPATVRQAPIQQAPVRAAPVLATPVNSAPVDSQPIHVPPPTKREQKETPPPKNPPPAQPRFTVNWRSPIVVLSVAAVGALAVILGIRTFVLGPVPVEPRVATATISAAQSAVYEDAAGTSEISKLSQGQQVNLLELPQAKDQQWIRGQYAPASQKAGRPGFLRVRDLDLSTLDNINPASFLALIRRMWGDATDTAAIQLEENALRSMIQRYPTTTAASLAYLELTQIELNLARMLRDSGQPESEWTPHIEATRAYLEMAGRDQSLRGRVDQIRQEIAAVTPVPKPPIPAPVVTTIIPRAPDPGAGRNGGKAQVSQVKVDLDRAEALLQSKSAEITEQSADVHNAEELVRGVLRAHPDDLRARSLMDKIRTLKAVLGL